MENSKLKDFKSEREKLNAIMSGYMNRTMKEFMGLDYRCYQAGALSATTKELLGLVASLVLRCDDCINYHIGQCLENKVSDEEFIETMTIGLIVGGSITIPHIRRAIETWDNERNNK